MTVKFSHPASTDIFEAECDGFCTADQAISGLIDAGFVKRPAGGEYQLRNKRTGTLLTAGNRFETAGVLDGDQLEVLHRVEGAAA